MDYRKFLGKVESAVLPYFGGGTVDAPSRRLRVATPVRPGWWRFEVQGRVATAREPAGPEGLDGLPRVRGHVWGSRLVREGAVAEPLELMPEEEPPRLALVSARRWHDGSLVFEGLEFEGEAEDAARRALEEGQSLSGAKGVSAALRAAFGYAQLETASRALAIRFAPAEVRAKVLDVAEGGRAKAEECLRHLVAEREAHLRAQAMRAAAVEAREYAAGLVAEAQRRAADDAYTAGPMSEAQRRALEREAAAGRVYATQVLAEAQRRAGHPGRRGAREDGMERAERALQSAGARLRDVRRLAGNQLEVTYTFMDERFITLVDAHSLQVVDAGVCLAGADSEVTLESLPSVIREAIDTGVLVITRHA
ncbi:hypothetical protein JY651_30815 [Pyxidicoccus parkwayensis]|uniref:Band 7 domain-containing protein n=1 Tax=Pyxidicoccus parkwayensis TaxID=2813578 RepID=A0ABX7NU85_9BACT|nr:hypothetical protein [Pyxidicoccus parkwaysis]QSQ19688.1 hypothetical protein JY651_30815 [Pyxidicoccus parkwaysis]